VQDIMPTQAKHSKAGTSKETEITNYTTSQPRKQHSKQVSGYDDNLIASIYTTLRFDFSVD